MQGKILSKAPCNDDLFEGGAHKNLQVSLLTNSGMIQTAP